jgi:hypothetical protein
MQIIDNFLPEDVRANILKEMDGLDFPWFYRDYSSHQGDGVPQFIHIFYIFDKVNSSFFSLITPMLFEFEQKTQYKIQSIARIKANLLTNAPVKESNIQKAKHTDEKSDSFTTCLYYLDDADGETIMYSDEGKTEVKRIKPKANRAVIFNSNTWHNATPPTKYAMRRVINLILKTK